MRESPLGEGTELRVWTLRTVRLKRLTARLVVATDGAARVADDVEYRWDKWGPDAGGTSAQLVLLIEDGRAFGVKRRRHLRLGLDVAGGPSHIRSERRADLPLEGDWHSRMTEVMTPQPLSNKSVLYAKLLLPRADVAMRFEMLGRDMKAVASGSKGGQRVVAVLLEWEPQS